MSDLPVIERLSTEAAEVNASIIWLHGLGADGNDFVPVVPQLNLPADYAIRFVFPTAPSIPVTINNGFVMPAWYDILRLDNVRSIDEAGLRASAAKTQALRAHHTCRFFPGRRGRFRGRAFLRPADWRNHSLVHLFSHR